MTTPTLRELVDKLKTEPEWKENTGSGYDRLAVEHNATRARLLAVVEALNESQLCIETASTMSLCERTQRYLKTSQARITNKLAAALKEEK